MNSYFTNNFLNIACIQALPIVKQYVNQIQVVYIIYITHNSALCFMFQFNCPVCGPVITFLSKYGPLRKSVAWSDCSLLKPDGTSAVCLRLCAIKNCALPVSPDKPHTASHWPCGTAALLAGQPGSHIQFQDNTLRSSYRERRDACHLFSQRLMHHKWQTDV